MEQGGMQDRSVALVTGASRGIGRACALALAARGTHVAVNYRSNETAAFAVVEKIRAGGGSAETCRFDVGDTAAGAAAIDDLVRRHGRLDILVNNAAVTADGLLLRLKDEDWSRQLDVNLTGPMSLSRAAARHMMRQRRGAIVNISSVVGEAGNPGQTAYAAAKAGLIGFSKALARELGSRQVRVNVVSPGFVETDMTAAIPVSARDEVLTRIPLGRFGDPDDVAAAVVFLCSDAAAYITGEVLRVNGGLLT